MDGATRPVRRPDGVGSRAARGPSHPRPPHGGLGRRSGRAVGYRRPTVAARSGRWDRNRREDRVRTGPLRIDGVGAATVGEVGLDRTVGRCVAALTGLLHQVESGREGALDLSEAHTQFADPFVVEGEPLAPHVFEDPDVPVRDPVLGQGHVHDQHVSVEVEHPGRFLSQAAQLPDGVHVEDEEAAVDQMVVDGVEHRLPGIEGEEMVQGVEDADDDIEPLTQPELLDVPEEQPGPGDLGAGHGQHLRRAVHAGQRRQRGQLVEDRSRAAAQLEDRSRIRAVPFDRPEDAGTPRSRVVHGSVVEAGKVLVVRHRPTVPHRDGPTTAGTPRVPRSRPHEPDRYGV